MHNVNDKFLKAIVARFLEENKNAMQCYIASRFYFWSAPLYPGNQIIQFVIGNIGSFRFIVNSNQV